MADEMPIMPGTELKPQRMLYEQCPSCCGEPRRWNKRPCICKTGYVPVGVVVSQLEHLAKVNELRHACGITMAMLREGRCGPIEKPAADRPDDTEEPDR